MDFLSFVLNKPPPVAENKFPKNNSNWFDMSTTPTKDHEDLQLHIYISSSSFFNPFALVLPSMVFFTKSTGFSPFKQAGCNLLSWL